MVMQVAPNRSEFARHRRVRAGAAIPRRRPSLTVGPAAGRTRRQRGDGQRLRPLRARAEEPIDYRQRMLMNIIAVAIVDRADQRRRLDRRHDRHHGERSGLRDAGPHQLRADRSSGAPRLPKRIAANELRSVRQSAATASRTCAGAAGLRRRRGRRLDPRGALRSGSAITGVPLSATGLRSMRRSWRRCRSLPGAGAAGAGVTSGFAGCGRRASGRCRTAIERGESLRRRGTVVPGAGMRCEPTTERTSLITRACSRGDLSMLRWSMLGSELTSTLTSEPWKPAPLPHVGVVALRQVERRGRYSPEAANDCVPSNGTTSATGTPFWPR